MNLTTTTKSAAPPHALAPAWHTVTVILALGANAYSGWHRAAAVRLGASVDRPGVYLRTILMEWLLLALVFAGVWLHKMPLRAVLGPRWDSFRAFGNDLGIAIALLTGSILITSLLGPHHGGAGTDPAVRFLMPESIGEKCLWVLVALSAGVCEEAVYRGYLQRQLTALTRSAPAGIVLSAAMFGAAHAYQGLRNALAIAAGALLSGAVAFWRNSVRPGMIAHTLQDLLALVVAH